MRKARVFSIKLGIILNTKVTFKILSYSASSAKQTQK